MSTHDTQTYICVQYNGYHAWCKSLFTDTEIGCDIKTELPTCASTKQKITFHKCINETCGTYHHLVICTYVIAPNR